MNQLKQIGGHLDIQGESPVWCAREQALYWVDTRSRLVRRLNHASGRINTWQLPEFTCSIVIRDAGGLLIAMQNAIVLFDTGSGEIVERISAPHLPEAGMRFADGRCDRRGRFWVGAKHDASSAPIGFLYRFDPDRSFTAMETNVAMPNALSWSPDNRTMYFADAAVRTIFTYAFDMERGTIANRKSFASCDWSPDGAAMDSDGYLWNAGYRGWRVTRPTGA
ncbi:MAG: SMP-30/gluconolactonase/LRE family protein [Betaproteobacteria bacterium]|nr:SMP-30/gluconolactonase/LRE family protein [Betaproteobacteria bacterium]